MPMVLFIALLPVLILVLVLAAFSVDGVVASIDAIVVGGAINVATKLMKLHDGYCYR